MRFSGLRLEVLGKGLGVRLFRAQDLGWRALRVCTQRSSQGQAAPMNLGFRV